MIQGPFEAVVLLLGELHRDTLFRGHLIKDLRQVDALGLPVIDGLPHVEQVDATDHVFHLPEAELGHDLAQFFGDEEEVIDHVFWSAGEARTQDRVLSRHADGAGVEVAFAHHDAADRDERRRRESELICAQQRADSDVPASAQAAVDLHRDPPAQLIQHQRLLRLCEADFPRRSGVRQRRKGRCARAAFKARDRHMVRARLGDAGRDRADADFGHQLHRDARNRVHVLEVVNQLRQVFDRIDVVVWRRRDQADARR